MHHMLRFGQKFHVLLIPSFKILMRKWRQSADMTVPLVIRHNDTLSLIVSHLIVPHGEVVGLPPVSEEHQQAGHQVSSVTIVD